MAYSRLDRGIWNLWLRDQTTGLTRRVADVPCNQIQPSWESDSRTLLYDTDLRPECMVYSRRKAKNDSLNKILNQAPLIKASMLYEWLVTPPNDPAVDGLIELAIVQSELGTPRASPKFSRVSCESLRRNTTQAACVPSPCHPVVLPDCQC